MLIMRSAQVEEMLKISTPTMTRIVEAVLAGTEANPGYGKARIFTQQDVITAATYWDLKQIFDGPTAKKAALELRSTLEKGDIDDPVLIFDAGGFVGMASARAYTEEEQVRQREINRYLVFYRPQIAEVKEAFKTPLPV